MKKTLLTLFVLLFSISLMAQHDENIVIDSVADWGTVAFEALKREPLWGTMSDAESRAKLDPNNFDITVEVENDFLYETPKLHVEGEKIILDIHPKGEWCECFFPTNLNIKVHSTQKQGAYDEEGKHYAETIHPIHIKVLKNRAWLPRCFWVIASIVGLILLFIYVRAMMRKRRFKKGAMINPLYYRNGVEVKGQGQRLRDSTFTAWIARWFWPGVEKRTLKFIHPNVSVTFWASESSEAIELPKSSFNPNTMDIDCYRPQNDNSPEKNIRIGNNNNITIYKNNRVIKDGSLRFSANDKSDGGGYRVFLTVVMVASVIAIIGLCYLMVKSFM